mgnify:CR=1 FL=1
MKVTIRNMVVSAMFFAIGMILPFITGQIQQIGNMLLPMHIPVLLCGMICGWQYGAIIGFLLPFVRFATFVASIVSFATIDFIFTTRPLSPSNGAPPYSEEVNLLITFFIPGFTSAPPIFPLAVSIMDAFITLTNAPPTPSYSFKITFPTNASQTITS